MTLATSNRCPHCRADMAGIGIATAGRLTLFDELECATLAGRQTLRQGELAPEIADDLSGALEVAESTLSAKFMVAGLLEEKDATDYRGTAGHTWPDPHQQRRQVPEQDNIDHQCAGRRP